MTDKRLTKKQRAARAREQEEARAWNQQQEETRKIVSREELEARKLRWLRDEPEFGYTPETLQEMPEVSRRMLLAEAESEVLEQMAAERQQLQELARQLPGRETSDPIDKIIRYLLIVYDGFSPEQLRKMAPDEIKSMVDARPPKERGATGPVETPAARRAKSKSDHRQRVQVVLPNAARDKWLNREASKRNPPTWKALMAELGKIASQKGWKKHARVQGVQQAVKRYRKRNGLPPLPRRKED